MDFAEYATLNEGSSAKKSIKNVVRAIRNIKYEIKKVSGDCPKVLDEVFGGDESDSIGSLLIKFFGPDAQEGLDDLEAELNDYEAE